MNQLSSGQDTRSALAALAALALAMLLSSLGTSIANVALPALAQAFGAPYRQLQWIVLAYLLAMTAVVVLAGWLGDKLGRRRLLLAGIGLFSSASLLCALAPSLRWLVAARAAQGCGAAVMTALAMAMAASGGPQARSGRAMGLLASMSAAGTALGPALGGLLIAGFGWPAVFTACMALGALAWMMAYRWVPRDTPQARAGGPAGAGALLRDHRRWAACAANALIATVMMTTLVVGPFHLQAALGLDAARTGLVMSLGPLAAMLAGLPAGRMVDRFGAGRMTLAGLAVMGMGCAALALLPPSLGVPGYAAPLALLTVGYALFQAAHNSAVMDAVLPGQRGLMSGLLNLWRQIGLIAGIAVMGALFARGAGMRGTFGLAALLVCAALLTAVFSQGPARRAA